MSDRLPHVREPSSGEPDICIYCREEWVDLLTLYETDECSVRLRAEVERLRSWAEKAAAAENENAEDARRERGAVVAWLRREVDDDDNAGGPLAHVCGILSDAIERGEHRREGGE